MRAKGANGVSAGMRTDHGTEGSYGLALISFAVATFTAAGLMIGLGPYRVWEPVAEPVVAAGVSRA